MAEPTVKGAMGCGAPSRRATELVTSAGAGAGLPERRAERVLGWHAWSSRRRACCRGRPALLLLLPCVARRFFSGWGRWPGRWSQRRAPAGGGSGGAEERGQGVRKTPRQPRKARPQQQQHTAAPGGGARLQRGVRVQSQLHVAVRPVVALGVLQVPAGAGQGHRAAGHVAGQGGGGREGVAAAGQAGRRAGRRAGAPVDRLLEALLPGRLLAPAQLQQLLVAAGDEGEGRRRRRERVSAAFRRPHAGPALPLLGAPSRPSASNLRAIREPSSSEPAAPAAPAALT